MSDDSDAVGLSSPSLAEVEDPISKESKRLRRHLGLGDTPDMPPSNPPPDVMPLFLIERAPGSRNGSKCKLSSCSKRIMPGQYRVVLKPAMSAPDWLRSSSQTSGKSKNPEPPVCGPANKGKADQHFFVQTTITSLA